jgi:hypothetical protein
MMCGKCFSAKIKLFLKLFIWRKFFVLLTTMQQTNDFTPSINLMTVTSSYLS